MAGSSEDQLLEAIAAVKARLVELKKDRTKFVQANKVIELYNEFASAVEGRSIETTAADTHLFASASDLLLIFSLAFLTVGMTDHLAAPYAMLRALDHLLEYMCCEPNITPNELKILWSAVREVERVLSASDDRSDMSVSPELQGLVMREAGICSDRLKMINLKVEGLTGTEQALYCQIIHVRRTILSLVTSAAFSSEEVATLAEKVCRIEAHMKESCPKPSSMLKSQIADTKNFCEWYKNGPIVHPDFQTQYNQLADISAKLEAFLITHRWTPRETDLYQFILSLERLHDEVAVTRQNLSSQNLPLKDQILPAFLLRKCYSIIFKLLSAAEPVSEALSPIFNQLMTLKRCLLEVQKIGSIKKVRELFPYQMKLKSLDDLRDNGKFIVDGQIPPGQGVLNNILAECFDLMYELKVELEEQGGGEDDDEDDEDDDDDASEIVEVDDDEDDEDAAAA